MIVIILVTMIMTLGTVIMTLVTMIMALVTMIMTLVTMIMTLVTMIMTDSLVQSSDILVSDLPNQRVPCACFGPVPSQGHKDDHPHHFDMIIKEIMMIITVMIYLQADFCRVCQNSSSRC